jgi:hypothetical protein
MDRRTFMMTGAWLSTTAGSVWPWLTHAAARGNTLAIVDSTLVHGPAFAQFAGHMKLPIFETGDDIGALWYTTLAPRVRLMFAREPISPVSLIGLTRASDYFVLRDLATRAGLRAEHEHEHEHEHAHEQRTGSAARPAHITFAFAPRTLVECPREHPRQNL